MQLSGQKQSGIRDSLYLCTPKSEEMIAVDKNRCPHNHVCPLIKICPQGAITQDGEGFPVIDYDLCIECGQCVASCPMKAMRD